MQVMSIKVTPNKKADFTLIVVLLLASLVLGHPMAYEKQLEKNPWSKFAKDRDTSLVKDITEGA